LNISYCAEIAGNSEMMQWAIKELREVEAEDFKFAMGLILKTLQERGKDDIEKGKEEEEIVRLKEELDQQCGEQFAEKGVPRMLYYSIVTHVAQSEEATTPEDIQEALKSSQLISTYHNVLLPAELDR